MVGQFMVCFTRFIFPRSTQKEVHAFDLFMCEIGYGLINVLLFLILNAELIYNTEKKHIVSTNV